jgi:protein unc-119
MEAPITQEYVKSLTNITDDFLCDLNANIYNIKFLKFRVRDMESDNLLFEVCDDSQEPDENDVNGESSTNRSIRYHLGPEFLELRNIATELVFSVGNIPVRNLVMIERHYFKGNLIKSFEFKFDFCIPNSTNTWETIYEIPELDPKIKKEMIETPWETKSDSFYFVDNKLIMHHKAFYNYSPFDD